MAETGPIRTPDQRLRVFVSSTLQDLATERPGFELTSENAETVAEICRRLDGLPLAIELAAARVRLLPPRTLLGMLDDRIGVLTGGARDLPERQRTLRNTLDWSFGLLSPAEQVLFSCLGVFPGTFGLEAAAAVAGSGRSGPAGHDPAGEVIDTLSSLADASLVRYEHHADQPRFSMLGTIRDYARERLQQSGQWNDVHDRHAAHFLAFAESARAGLEGPSQVTFLDQLEAEHDNLGAAMSWFLDRGQPGLAHSLGAVTRRFWWLRGHVEELARYGQEIVANGEGLPPGQLGYAQNGLGLMLIASGDPAQAQVLFEEALALFRSSGDRLGIAITAAALGHQTALRGEYARARELLTESLTLHQEMGNNVSIALVYNFLGQIPLRQGDNEAAAQLFRQELDAAHRVPDRFPLLISLYDLALSSQAREDLAVAAGFLREGLSVARDAGDNSSVGYYLQRLAALTRPRGEPDRAVRLLAAADAMLEAAGTGWMLAYVATAPAAMGRQQAVEYALHGRNPG